MSATYDSGKTFTIVLGERRHFTVTVTSSNEESQFTINSASWKLYKTSVPYAVEGDCEIVEHTASFFLEPTEIGTYLLDITYTIADEIYILRSTLNVIK